ncbi:MAG: hypothetical protein H6587_06965 [Flavobacteriales bacterium]|nr:hypothetical protein [Flavobacteriales bacterium]MCB9364289.1 hypothetical protein [Flavobacteriales bacterium]
MIILITFLFLFVSAKAHITVQQLLHKHFTNQEASICNTGKSTEYLDAQEKQVILYVNLARIYPSKFAQFYKEYLELFDERGYKKFEKKDHYYFSLYKDLLKLKQNKLVPVKPDKELYEYAKCWAKESGKKGIIGHSRVKCKKGYFAECCSYGNLIPLEFVLNLLVDERIPSLGHRKILFTNYSKCGVAIDSHKTYGQCVVIDII